MKTAVVILNWNGKGFLERFLPGLLASVGQDPVTEAELEDEVIIADNASTDGSLELLAERFPGVRVLKFDRNYGFTGGYNKAFASIEAEYYVLINSDIEVTDGWLYPLKEWMELHEDCAACAPKLHSWQDREMFEYAGAAGGFIDRFGYPFCRGRILKRVERDNGQYDMPCEVLWATGACLMVRAEAWKKLGGLDERFFAHMEEIDFCWRARNEGYTVYTVPRSLVYHLGGGTLPAESPWKLFLNYRNNLMMLENNLPKSIALWAAYTVLAYNAQDFEVCADDYVNCLEVYRDMPERMRVSVIEACVKQAMATTRSTIFKRKVLDGMSSIVYLVTGKFSYMKAVVKAHGEFRKLRRKTDREELAGWLAAQLASEDGAAARTVLDVDIYAGKSDRAVQKCIMDSSIILMSLAYRDEVFDAVRDFCGENWK